MTIFELNNFAHAQSITIKRKTEFKKSKIESFGPLVKGEFLTTLKDDKGNDSSTHFGIELYFCGLEESITVYEESRDVPSAENSRDFVFKTDSSESRWSLNYQKDTSSIVQRGYEVLLVEMKKNARQKR